MFSFILKQYDNEDELGAHWYRILHSSSRENKRSFLSKAHVGRDESVKNFTKEILSHMLSQTLWQWQQVAQGLCKVSFYMHSDKS